MPKLAIFDHELFARTYVRTDNAACAYRRAYGEDISPSEALALGAAVLAIPEVAARVKEYQDDRKELDRSCLGLPEWREFIADLTRTPICNIDANSRLCHSWKRTYGKDGAVLSEEFKVPDKFRAVSLDVKLAEAQDKQEIRNSKTLHTLDDFEKHYAMARA